MQLERLGINRSSDHASRSPAWLNFLSIVTAAVLLLSISFWTVFQSEKALKENVASKLETILQIESEAVRQWVGSENQLATLLVAEANLAEVVLSAGRETESSSENETATATLAGISRKLRNKTCLLMAADGKVVARSGADWLLEKVQAHEQQIWESLSSNRGTFSSVWEHGGDAGSLDRFGLVIAAPIQHAEEGLVGFLGIGHDIGDELTTVLASSRSGESGETLAVSKFGRLISDSRFSGGSRELALFLESHREHIKDVVEAVEVELDGIQDQRGVESVFASRWMPKIGIGLVTKMDYSEAHAPVNQIRRFVWTLFGLLLLTTVSTLVYRWFVYRLRTQARHEELNQKRLGAYDLEHKIGEGGMGIVYQATHALMRRPTAIKILPPEKSSRTAIERFEREVKFTSQLKHPNTISIYDYGRTDSGLFYYAMELLNGFDLEQLVQRTGPLPDGRVMEILRQVCESLREAHSLGLVHRDIKPANIMLCNRGGALDTVKVLDFGMVRDRDHSKKLVDDSGALSGTPTYMAPECFTEPEKFDNRVDVFAVGAVGFFLLTGRALFEAEKLSELFRLHQLDIQAFARKEITESRKRFNLPTSTGLIALVSQSVAASKNDRPSSVGGVLDELAKCDALARWDGTLAEQWWSSAKAFDDSTSFQSRVDEASENDVALDVTQLFVPARYRDTSN